MNKKFLASNVLFFLAWIVIIAYLFGQGGDDKLMSVMPTPAPIDYAAKYFSEKNRADSLQIEEFKKWETYIKLTEYTKRIEGDYKIVEERSNFYKGKIDAIKKHFAESEVKDRVLSGLSSASSLPRDNTNYFKDTPYETFEEFIVYWGEHQGMAPYAKKHDIPARTIITRLWKETRGGKAGSAGKQGAIFAEKAKKGDKVIYAPDDDFDKNGKKIKSKFKKYNSRAEAIDGFCILLKQGNKGRYWSRYNAWKKEKPKMEKWKCWAYAMQVHPVSVRLSWYSYASQWVEMYGGKDNPKYRYMIGSKNSGKTITAYEFWKIRKSSSDRSIELTMKHDKLFKKYGY
tara:strand:+ start:7717 stop:8745 length:1029 start_codon:yes stop_codon:yes gene_type:complete